MSTNECQWDKSTSKSQFVQNQPLLFKVQPSTLSISAPTDQQDLKGPPND